MSACKSRKVAIIGIELIVIVLCFFFCIVGRIGKYQIIDVPLSSWQSRNIKYSGADWHIDEGVVDKEGDAIDLLYGPYVTLPAGHYTVSIDYSCEFDQSAHPFASGGGTNAFIKGSSFVLDKNQTHASYRFHTIEDLDNFEIVVNYNRQGSFTISGITISTNNDGWKCGFLWILFVSLVADGILVLRTLSVGGRKNVLCVIFISLLTSLPLFFSGVNDGHDLNFHLMRIEAIEHELLYGHFPVRIGSLWMGGYGYPTSIYYGDILLYFPAVLRILGVSITATYKIFAFTVNLVTTAIADFFYGKMFDDQKIGTLVTLTYITASYRLTDLYVRSSVGEYSVFIFFPVVAYALWNMYSDKNVGIRKNVVNGIILGLGMAGVVSSHVLSAEMIGVGIILLIIMTIRETFTVNNIRTYLIATASTVILSLFFLVPFIDYYRNVPVNITEIVDGTSKKIQGAGLGIAEYFSFFQNPFGASGQMLCTSGIILMGALIVAIIIWAKHRASRKMKTLTILSVCMLFMASNLFPWNDLAYKVPFVNMLAQVQFPWRYVTMAILVQSILLGSILKENDFESAFIINSEKAAELCIGLSLIMTFVFTSFYEDNATRSIYYDTGNINTYGVMSGEYLRSGTDVGKLTGLFSSDNAEYINVIDRDGTDFNIECKVGGQDAVIEAPILNYKGYEVTDDHGNSYAVRDGSNCVVSFTVPAGFDGNIHIRFVSPWYWTASLIISVMALLISCVILYRSRKEIG